MPDLPADCVGVTHRGQQSEERADSQSFLCTVAELAVGVHGVAGAPPGPGADEVAGGFQVSHDGLHGAFREADNGADVADTGFGVAGDLHEHAPVPGQQRPGAAPLIRMHAPDLNLASALSRLKTRVIFFMFILTGLHGKPILAVSLTGPLVMGEGDDRDARRESSCPDATDQGRCDSASHGAASGAPAPAGTGDHAARRGRYHQ